MAERNRTPVTDGAAVARLLRAEGVCAIATDRGRWLRFYPDGKLTEYRRAWLEAGDGYRKLCLRDWLMLGEHSESG